MSCAVFNPSNTSRAQIPHKIIIYPSKHGVFTQRCFNAGPMSKKTELKRRQPLTPYRRQHDKADSKGLVINLDSRFTEQLLSSRKNVVFISPRLCRTHILYRYSYIVLSLYLTMTENINQLGSKLERAPSCIRQHSGPP